MSNSFSFIANVTLYSLMARSEGRLDPRFSEREPHKDISASETSLTV